MTGDVANPAKLETGAAEWMEPIAAELSRVEDVLREAVGSSVPRILEASRNLLDGGGKRLRPALVLLWARACGRDWNPDDAINVGAATELIHMASLMHDDVIDGSSLRRGRATANASWGNKLSILTGDYILSRAFQLLVRDGGIEVMRILSSATTGMAESEALQAINEGSVEAWRADYWRIIHGKTADFMAACSEVGALIGGASPDQRKAAAEYGTELGLAFQITDDLLDLIGTPDVVGKLNGSDLRDGKVTLPVLLTLERCAADERVWISKLAASCRLTDANMDRVRRLAESTGALKETRALAARHSALAVESLTGVAESPAKNALRALADYVIERSS